MRRMELVAEAVNFSAREAVKARQLARSIEDQEQFVAPRPFLRHQGILSCLTLINRAIFYRYTRVREWMAEDKLAEEARARARRVAVAALKQEAHRYMLRSAHVIALLSVKGWFYICVTRRAGNLLLVFKFARSKLAKLLTQTVFSGAWGCVRLEVSTPADDVSNGFHQLPRVSA